MVRKLIFFVFFYNLVIPIWLSAKEVSKSQIGIVLKPLYVLNEPELKHQKENIIQILDRGDYFYVIEKVWLQNEFKLYYKIQVKDKIGFILNSNKFFLNNNNKIKINKIIKQVLLLSDLNQIFSGRYGNLQILSPIGILIWSKDQGDLVYTISNGSMDFRQHYKKITKIDKNKFILENEKSKIILYKISRFIKIKVIKSDITTNFFPKNKFFIYPIYELSLGKYNIIVPKVNVRQSYDTKSKILYQLDINQIVDVIDVDPKIEQLYNRIAPWVKIRDSKGREGYIWGGLLKPVEKK